MSIDFGALKAKASAMLDAAESPAPEAPKVEAPVAQAAEVPEVRVQAGQAAPEAETPIVETPVVPQPTELSDDALVRVLVDGEEQVLPWKDARGKISGGLKFTKNMQQLAKEREEFAGNQARLQQLEGEHGQLRTLLANPNALRAFTKQMYGLDFAQTAQPEAPAQMNVDEIATVGQAQQLAVAQAQQLEQRLQQTEHTLRNQIQAVTHEIEHRQQTAKHALVINTALQEIFTANPMLQSVPNIEDVIRFEVAKAKPQTEEAALELFKSVSTGIAENLNKHYNANKKVQAVAQAKQKLESKTIEPASGTAPTIQPTSYKNTDGTVNWKKVREMANSYNG